MTSKDIKNLEWRNSLQEIKNKGAKKVWHIVPSYLKEDIDFIFDVLEEDCCAFFEFEDELVLNQEIQEKAEECMSKRLSDKFEAETQTISVEEAQSNYLDSFVDYRLLWANKISSSKQNIRKTENDKNIALTSSYAKIMEL